VTKKLSSVKRRLGLENVVARHLKKWLGNVMRRLGNWTKRLGNVIETSVPENIAARNETRTTIAAVLLIDESRLLCH
jgi:hypothetical protein